MKSIILSLLLLTTLTPLTAQPKSSWRSATAAELQGVLPARAQVEKERIETEMRTAFVGMLHEMTRFDVMLLAKMASAPEPPAGEWSFLATHLLPDDVTLQTGGKLITPRKDVEISLGNLGRLGCLTPAATAGGFDSFAMVRLTELGRAFVKACSR